MKFRTWLEGVLEREGRDEYVGRYKTPGGKTFEVWVRVTGKNSARITYLRGYGQGAGTFIEVLSQLVQDLKSLGLTDISYSTAMDDETQGQSRERLFAKYRRIADEL